MRDTSGVTRVDGLDRRGFLRLSGAAGISALLAGCGAGSTTSAGSGKGTIRVLVEAGGKAELAEVATRFKATTGNTVTLVELPYDGLYNRINSELSAGSPSFDVAALDAIWLSAFAGAVAPLDELFTDEVKADLFPALVQEANVNGKYVGMPVWTNAEILFYRKDLFEDDKEASAFERRYGYALVPPKDWKQFRDVAEHFTRKNLHGTDVKGAVETEWLAHVAQAGSPGLVLDGSGGVIIDNPEHVAALQFYSDLASRYKVSPSGAAQADWAAAQNLFNQGRTAMMRFWAHAFPQIPKDSPIYGKAGAAPMIAGSAGIGAVPGPWYLSIPAKGKQSALAKQFVKFAYDNNALGIKSSLGLAARRSAFEHYQDQKGYEHFKPLLETLSASATKPRPATAKWQQIVDTVLVPTIQKSLSPGADYAGLLASARGDVERLVG